ncbi:MAG TPA: hypothetical protein VK817_03310 [Trebonia sp.]|jgi:8-oxo-dGTP diphosphatase|nr:hypothetical protein [Trebonia sp.]
MNAASDDGTREPGIIEWVCYRELASRPIFPLIGQAVTALASPRAPVASTYLPRITDQNYTWA